ncbi:MAG: acyltransferase family protein [Schaedlerella sp.]|nr:acyltransferase family protein [Schaedlerella sp.]
MQKNYNIEMVRALSFVMVIVIHVANYFSRAFEHIGMGEYLFSLILNTFARVSVPCFFMISGALLLGRNETMKKSLQRVQRFLPVLVVWTIIYYFFNTYYMDQTVVVKKLLKVPAEAHLWYLYVMIPIYLVLPFLQAICRGMDQKLERAFIIMGSIIVVLQPIMFYSGFKLYYDIPIFGNRVYIYYLFLGYFITKYKDQISKRRGLWLTIYLVSSAGTVVATTIGSIIMGDHMEQLLTYGCPLIIISSAAFFIMILQAGNGNLQLKDSVKKTIDLCCGCSFGIYLIHILFLDNFKKYVKAYEVSAYWVIPVLVVGIMGASLLCIYLIRKTSIGRKIT